MREMMHYLKPYWKGLIAATIAVAISTVCDLLLPAIMSEILNKGVYRADFAYIVRCCAIMAAVALVGLGANAVDVAIYPKTHTDAAGAALTGEKTYTIHFETLPPTLEGGFWSVTAYNEENFLIDNPIDRYCVNDRSAYRLNEDGTLDITLSKEAPEDPSNWLPVSDGEFHLFMRIYLPDMNALDAWQPPVIHIQE